MAMQSNLRIRVRLPFPNSGDAENGATEMRDVAHRQNVTLTGIAPVFSPKPGQWRAQIEFNLFPHGERFLRQLCSPDPNRPLPTEISFHDEDGISLDGLRAAGISVSG